MNLTYSYEAKGKPILSNITWNLSYKPTVVLDLLSQNSFLLIWDLELAQKLTSCLCLKPSVPSIVINPYVLPKVFPTFAEMIHHWYKIVKDQDRSNCKDWRKHLTKAEKRRFQRLSRIMRAFQKVMIEGVKIREAENQFEAFYQSNNKSLTKLCDKYAKQFLLWSIVEVL